MQLIELYEWDGSKYVNLFYVMNWDGRDVHCMNRPICYEWMCYQLKQGKGMARCVKRGSIYEFSIGGAAMNYYRRLLGIEDVNKESVWSARDAKLDRLNLSMASSLGDEYRKMCERDRLEVQRAASYLCEYLGVDVQTPARVKPVDRYNPDLDAAFMI